MSQIERETYASSEPDVPCSSVFNSLLPPNYCAVIMGRYSQCRGTNSIRVPVRLATSLPILANASRALMMTHAPTYPQYETPFFTPCLPTFFPPFYVAAYEPGPQAKMCRLQILPSSEE